MASSEFQPAPPRGPEFRPDIRPVQAPEVLGRPVEAAPASANLAPVPGSAPATGSADHSQPATVATTPKRAMVSLGRSTVKSPERADASRYVDQTRRVVPENREDPAVQKDEIIRIKEAYQEFKESVGV